MPKCRLNLLVVRSNHPEETRTFYEAIGLRFQEEQHGNGPIHLAAECEGFVFEIYPVTDDSPQSQVRLGFAVDSLETIANRLGYLGHNPISPAKMSPWGFRGVWQDPDGNKVELVEHT